MAILIDGSNLWATTGALHMRIDYRKLLKHFSSQGALLRALYFTATKEEGETDNLRPLLDWLEFNGYTMVTRPVKEIRDSITGEKVIKGNMDMEIGVELMRYASLVDHIVLFTGDGDFTYAVKTAQQIGVRVTVVSTIQTNPPMIANELRRQADVFIDLVDLINSVKLEDDDVVPKPTSRLGHALSSRL